MNNKLTNEELRSAIGKARGWILQDDLLWSYPYGNQGERIVVDRMPQWSTNMKDAWILFDELPAKKALICRGDNRWTCGCNGEDLQLVCENETLDIEHYPIENTTDAAARAVALTWLAWNGEKKMTDEIVRNLFMVRVKAGDSGGYEPVSILAKRAEVVDGDLMIFDYAPPHVSEEGRQQDFLVQAFKAGYWLSVSVLASPEK